MRLKARSAVSFPTRHTSHPRPYRKEIERRWSISSSEPDTNPSSESELELESLATIGMASLQPLLSLVAFPFDRPGITEFSSRDWLLKLDVSKASGVLVACDLRMLLSSQGSFLARCLCP